MHLSYIQKRIHSTSLGFIVQANIYEKQRAGDAISVRGQKELSTTKKYLHFINLPRLLISLEDIALHRQHVMP
jgi:hypothetical protein